MFQGNTVFAGVLFLLGILVNSRINGFYAVLGAGLPIPFALLLGVDDAVLNAINTGINHDTQQKEHSCQYCIPLKHHLTDVQTKSLQKRE